MKCPRCGRELQPNETFCPGCGWRIENSSDGQDNQQQTPQHNLPPYVFRMPPKKQPSRFERIFRAVIAVLFYAFIMVCCQSCVMSGYMSSIMLREGVAIDYDAIMNQAQRLIEAVNEKSVQILLVANLITILLLCAIFHLRRKNPAKEMGLFFVNPFRIPTFALFGASLNVFVSVTLSFIPLPESVLDAFEGQYSTLYGGTSVLLEIISVAVVAGIVEELIFRGIAMSRLKPVIGTVGAVIVSAVIFGISHGTPIAIGYATVLGIVFGLIYNAFESAVPTIVCHVFFNATSYALALVPEDKGMLLIGLYILSIGAIFWCVYRIFIRRPTFNDMVVDKYHRIKPLNEEEANIISRVQEIQKSDMNMLDESLMDEIIELEERWKANRENNKKSRK